MKEQMTAADLSEIRERAERATPGEWNLKKDGRYEDHDECRIELPDDDIELCRYENGEFIAHAREDIPALLAEVERLRAMVNPITGETSDGYHTFNELYHHRAVLFSVICNARPDIAWKARKHNDGTMYEGDFIVGIQTPDGQAAYHYSADRYWELFRVPILDRAPIWDGYTPTQAIERIGHLRIKNEWEEAYAEQSGVINRLEDENAALREVERLKAELVDEKDDHAGTILLRDSMYAEKDAENSRLRAELEAAKKDLHMLSDEYKFCDTCKHSGGAGVDGCTHPQRFSCDRENFYERRGAPSPGEGERGGGEG